MASVRIKFRSSTVEGKEGTLYFQIIHKRVARTVFTDCRVFTSEWDSVSSSVVTVGTDERKTYLEMVASKLKWSMERFTKIIAGKEKGMADYSVDDIVSGIQQATGMSYFIQLHTLDDNKEDCCEKGRHRKDIP